MSAAPRVVVISDAKTWPLYPILPLTRGRGDHRFNEGNLGFVVAGGGPIVYRGSIYDIPPGLDLSRFKSTEYESMEALLAAGWVVD